MNKILTIATNTFREAIRNKILYSVIFFGLLLMGVAAVFGAVTIGDTVKVIKDFGLFSLSFFGAIITIVSGVNLLSKELKQKTIYNILSKPVARWEFILGKYLGLCLTVQVLVGLMGLGLIALSSIYSGQVEWLLFQGILYVFLEVMVIAAVALFFSSVVVTVTLTGLFTLATYIAGRSISEMKFFLSSSTGASNIGASNTEASPLMSIVVQVFDYILPDLSIFNIANTIVYGQSVSAGNFLNSLGYAVLYSGTVLAIGAYIFSKRELVSA